MVEEQEVKLAPGQIAWCSSDEDSGPDVGILIGLPDGSRLYVGEMPNRSLEEWADPNMPYDCWHIVHYTLDNRALILGTSSSTWRDLGGDDVFAAAMRQAS